MKLNRFFNKVEESRHNIFRERTVLELRNRIKRRKQSIKKLDPIKFRPLIKLQQNLIDNDIRRLEKKAKESDK